MKRTEAHRRSGCDRTAYDASMSFTYAAPTRALPPACRWLLQDGSAHLLWNAGCIAMVTCDREGRWSTQIQWQRAVLRARCGSRDQGMRWIERWMEKRQGLPGSGNRKAVRRPAWIDAFEARGASRAAGERGSQPSFQRTSPSALSCEPATALGRIRIAVVVPCCKQITHSGDNKAPPTLGLVQLLVEHVQ